jgi:hypothetical protein
MPDRVLDVLMAKISLQRPHVMPLVGQRKPHACRTMCGWTLKPGLADFPSLCGHNTNKADGIAAMQLHAPRQHYDGRLQLTDIKAMFVQMRDHV